MYGADLSARLELKPLVHAQPQRIDCPIARPIPVAVTFPPMGIAVVDSASNLIFEHLKAIRAEIAAVKADTGEIKERLRSHDASINELRRSDVHVFEDQARQ